MKVRHRKNALFGLIPSRVTKHVPPYYMCGWARHRIRFMAHARRCGIDMQGRHAVPICYSVGRITAVDINDPETMELMIPAGFRITERAFNWMYHRGMDYVIAEA